LADALACGHGSADSGGVAGARPDPLGHQANVLGAVAQVLADRTAAAIAASGGQSPTSAAALSALAEFLDRPTIDQLRKVLGLTPSGAVRLVDRLADAGLVARGPGGDGRTRTVTLTDKGARVAESIRAARASALREVLGALPEADRELLDSLLGRVMAEIVEVKGGGAWICRMCDLTACGRAEGRCPAANAARRKYGHDA
jgi:DNA-binding MarR family transcriptional regulator